MLALPYDYHPEWEHLSARDITSDGVLLAHGTRLSTGQSTDLLLLPVDIAVDANRDGVIKFGGNYDDPAVAGKPQDKTEETKPFRFWCNDDDDGTDRATLIGCRADAEEALRDRLLPRAGPDRALSR